MPEGQSRADPPIQAEAGQQQAEEGGDDGGRREGDGLADPADRRFDGGVGGQTPAQVLAVAEDQEQAVIGAGSEHQGGEQQLEERGDLHAKSGRLGDERAGQGESQPGRGQRGQGCQGRAEGHRQQHQDEDGRDQFDVVGRLLPGALLVDQLGKGPGEVDRQTRPAGPEVGANGGHGRRPRPPRPRGDRRELDNGGPGLATG